MNLTPGGHTMSIKISFILLFSKIYSSHKNQ